MTWAIVPFINCWELTVLAVHDILEQTVPTRVLLIDQGSDGTTRQAIHELRMDPDLRRRVLAWHFDPAVPLSAAWNRALQFVADQGETEAWIVNNDVRLFPHTAEVLSRTRAGRNAYLVSGIGVDEAGWETAQDNLIEPTKFMTDFGGPDFSNFMLSIEGWRKYPFDERFRPAYCEDVDMHRRMLLAGDSQKIFGVNVPFWHPGSATINAMKGGAAAFSPVYETCAAVYAKKWGGKPNKETYREPVEELRALTMTEHARHAHLGKQGRGDWTTPHLFGMARDAYQHVLERVDGPTTRSEPE